MLEDEIVECPNCETKLHVKVHRGSKEPTYLISQDCPKCKTPAIKLEKLLAPIKKRKRLSVEKSYMKLDPRG